jgi:hypothetical protein
MGPQVLKLMADTKDGQGCPVCGSRRAACASLVAATPDPGLWCPELERALERLV